MQIYINRGGQQFGPFTLEQVNQALVVGQLLPNDFAFCEGLQQWTPLEQIQGVVVPGAGPVAAPAPIQAEIVSPTVSVSEESVVTEPVAEEAIEGASKKKRIIVIAGISVGVVTVICLLLFVYPGFLLPASSEVESVKPKIFVTDSNSTESNQTEGADKKLPDFSDVGPVSYFGDIKSIFEARCVECHRPKKKKGKLDMSNLQGLAAGVEGKPVYVAEKPEESLLVKSIYPDIFDPDDPMPPDDETPLTKDEKKKISAWIAQGAKD
jgi:hypothetical protein